jgi:hypothetical protein
MLFSIPALCPCNEWQITTPTVVGADSFIEREQSATYPLSFHLPPALYVEPRPPNVMFFGFGDPDSREKNLISAVS